MKKVRLSEAQTDFLIGFLRYRLDTGLVFAIEIPILEAIITELRSTK